MPKANVIPAALSAYKKSHIGVSQRFYPHETYIQGSMYLSSWSVECTLEFCFISQDVFADLFFCRQRLARGWTVWVFSPGRDGIFCTGPDRPWGPFSPLYCGYRVSLPWVKRPGRGVDYSPQLTSRLKIEFSYNSTVPRGPSWPVLGYVMTMDALASVHVLITLTLT